MIFNDTRVEAMPGEPAQVLYDRWTEARAARRAEPVQRSEHPDLAWCLRRADLPECPGEARDAIRWLVTHLEANRVLLAAKLRTETVPECSCDPLSSRACACRNEGARQEREAIAAWLRSSPVAADSIIGDIADDVEKGEHLATHEEKRVAAEPEALHVCEWVRTGSDTLFCFGCKTSLNEPEDK